MIDLQIFKNIGKHIKLTDAEKNLLKASLAIKTIKRKTTILQQGQLCKKIYFVESGSLRAFHVNEEGKESTIMFAIKDWWITDMDCFVNQKPALLTIESLEDSKIMELQFQSLENLYLTIPKFERFFRILFQKAYIREQQRTLRNFSNPTKERYHQFVKEYPAIAEKVTQKQIASYLGVTPEFLSAIKKK